MSTRKDQMNEEEETAGLGLLFFPFLSLLKKGMGDFLLHFACLVCIIRYYLLHTVRPLSTYISWLLYISFVLFLILSLILIAQFVLFFLFLFTITNVHELLGGTYKQID